MTGFTLLELLLVISLIALLAVLTWPNLDTASRSEHLDESGAADEALIAMCRAEAMSEALRYRITFRLDGSIKVRRQFDPIRAPHVFVPVERDWASGGAAGGSMGRVGGAVADGPARSW
jgi:prepilin-type N-terminal cleavage/methylation domain-containing protein